MSGSAVTELLGLEFESRCVHKALCHSTGELWELLFCKLLNFLISAQRMHQGGLLTSALLNMEAYSPLHY